jgi:hypothetical protein
MCPSTSTRLPFQRLFVFAHPFGERGITTHDEGWLNRVVMLQIKVPSAQQRRCHSPKPILLDTGELKVPGVGPWQPAIVPVSILRVGSLLIVAVPGEFTSMAGRRLRRVVRETVGGAWGDANITVAIAGLSNAYASYVVRTGGFGASRSIVYASQSSSDIFVSVGLWHRAALRAYWLQRREARRGCAENRAATEVIIELPRKKSTEALLERRFHFRSPSPGAANRLACPGSRRPPQESRSRCSGLDWIGNRDGS